MPLPLKNLEKSTARFSLPVVILPLLLASPLLMSAARPPALDSISATCSLEEAKPATPEQTDGANMAYRRESSNQPATAQAGAAGNGLTSFVRDRWNSVRRLIRENPYFTNGTPEQQAQAETLCLAQIQADYEVLIAQASGQPMQLALPDLGASPAPSTPESSTPAPNTPESREIAPSTPESSPLEPENQPAIQPVRQPPVQRVPAAPPTQPVQPQPTQGLPSAPTSTIDPAIIPTAQDPGTYNGPDVAPIPFNGIVIRTLADMLDGNYRYIAGAAEERAYSDEELRQRGGSVFVLKKVGDQVTGDLLPRIGLPGICVTGTVSGDVITGAAYPYDTTDSLQDSARQIGDNYEPHGSGALKIRQTRTEGNQLYYAGALLDLTEFTPINAGSSLPPASCQADQTGGRDQG